MAFFKSRQPGDAPAPSARQPESVDVLRRRAKHRLIGAVVLVLAGVVGFPMLFDSQPRPVPVDIQIDMPDKAKVAPLQIPPNLEVPHSSSTATAAVMGAVGGAAVVATAKSTETKVVPAASLGDKEQIVGNDTTKPQIKPEPKPEPKSEKKPQAKPEAKPVATHDDGARAKALLEGKPTAKESPKDSKSKSDEGDLRLVIQVGAFAEADKAQEARMKLERAGLKTYTHVAQTKEGKRIRVRVGPFATRAEAEKVAAKVKGLQLPASILTL